MVYKVPSGSKNFTILNFFYLFLINYFLPYFKPILIKKINIKLRLCHATTNIY